MDLPPSAYTAIGAASAAIIAGTISFVIAVLSKDQKTSEFRQSWIDGLREDVSELIAQFTYISDIVRVLMKAGKTKDEIREHLQNKDELFTKFEVSDARIQLRINPKEHGKLNDKLSAIRDYPKTGNILDSDEARTHVDGLISETQTVLKNEWKRVKRGEKVFVATKYISLIVSILALIIGFLYVNKYVSITIKP